MIKIMGTGKLFLNGSLGTDLLLRDDVPRSSSPFSLNSRKSRCWSISVGV